MTSIATQLQAFSALTTKQIQRAAARSLNRAITSLRAEAARKVTATLNVKASVVKDAVVLGKANASEALTEMKATINITGRPIPLFEFVTKIDRVNTGAGPRQEVYVKVIKGRPAKLVYNAFVATMSSGHEGVFKRVGSERLPIQEKFTTSVTDIFKNEQIVRDLLAYGREKFSDNFEHELQYQLSQL